MFGFLKPSNAKHRSGQRANRTSSFGSAGRHRNTPSAFGGRGGRQGLLPVDKILNRHGALYAGARTR